MSGKPRLGVFKFTSCDGCQLALLDCEDELLTVTDRLDIPYFREAARRPLRGHFDLALVEGSISTPEEREEIRDVRRRSRLLVAIGACATAGGLQAFRNRARTEEVVRAGYPRPEFLRVLATSTPVADHVPVNLELRGCPIDKGQLLEVLSAVLARRRPNVRGHAVCMECKVAGAVCVAVARGVRCLGPLTHAGCGALCPRHDRGCYGCYGPAADANGSALAQLDTPWVPRS